MTDDELMAEVNMFLAEVGRGESEDLEGTPEGTYLASLSRPVPAFNEWKISAGYAPVVRIYNRFATAAAGVWTGGEVSTSSAGMENAAHPA